MGVEGITVRSPPLSGDHNTIVVNNETIQYQKTNVDGVSIPERDVTIESRQLPQLQRTSESEHDLMEACRRRTSIPSTFTYGAIPTSITEFMEERRWRSFDSNASTSTIKAMSVDVLSTRIEQEQKEMRKRLRPRRRGTLFQSMQTLLSSDKGESLRLRQMQMMTEVATRNRSLAILKDMRTLAMTMDDLPTSPYQNQDQKRLTPRNSFISTIDTSVEQLLDGMMSTDQILSEDCLHHILTLQTQWLQQTVQMHTEKQYDTPRTTTTTTLSFVLQQFLSEFVAMDQNGRIPCAMDLPTSALIRFEKLLTKYKILRPVMKQSFDTLCLDTISLFFQTKRTATTTAHIWTERTPKDVMHSLIHEMMEGIVDVSWVNEKLRGVLQAFVEQMVYSRLSAICYRDHAVELDEQNTLWREQVVYASGLNLEQVGFPIPLPSNMSNHPLLFIRTIQALNRMPHLIPSCVLAAFLNAIRVLYEEAKEYLGLECSCISADVLLPLLVYILSRCELPHLNSQVFVMEQYAIETSQEGSEAAYYVACLQAAMGYIMMEVSRKSDEL